MGTDILLEIRAVNFDGWNYIKMGTPKRTDKMKIR